jgi:protein SCO1
MDYLAQKTVLMRWIVFLNVSFLLFCCKEKVSLPYYNSPEFTPVFVEHEQVAPKINHQISDFSFTDQHNSTITQKHIEGKVHVANFIFTSCGNICPKMTGNMKRVSETFHNDKALVILSYSVTPWIDSVGRLKQYAEENDIRSANWHLLTGSRAAIYNLARTSYFAEEDLGFTKDSTEFLHTEHFLLIDKTKRIRGIYNGTLQLEIDQLIQDINTLLKE